MSAYPLPETDGNMFMVVQWKDVVNDDSPWWQRFYCQTIYKWFMEFSLRVMKVPNPTQVTQVDGRKTTFSWLEHQGFFSSEDQADFACLAERWAYKRFMFGRALPSETGQYDSPWIYPRAKNPRKRAKPVLRMIIKDRKQEESQQAQLAGYIKKLNQVLDQ